VLSEIKSGVDLTSQHDKEEEVVDTKPIVLDAIVRVRIAKQQPDPEFSEGGTTEL
jgi:hypothetical protein